MLRCLLPNISEGHVRPPALGIPHRLHQRSRVFKRCGCLPLRFIKQHTRAINPGALQGQACTALPPTDANTARQRERAHLLAQVGLAARTKHAVCKGGFIAVRGGVYHQAGPGVLSAARCSYFISKDVEQVGLWMGAPGRAEFQRQQRSEASCLLLLCLAHSRKGTAGKGREGQSMQGRDGHAALPLQLPSRVPLTDSGMLSLSNAWPT